MGTKGRGGGSGGLIWGGRGGASRGCSGFGVVEEIRGCREEDEPTQFFNFFCHKRTTQINELIKIRCVWHVISRIYFGVYLWVLTEKAFT